MIYLTIEMLIMARCGMDGPAIFFYNSVSRTGDMVPLSYAINFYQAKTVSNNLFSTSMNNPSLSFVYSSIATWKQDNTKLSYFSICERISKKS